MELAFMAPDARRLDEANVELCVCSVWSDLRPLTGLAGLLDWRLGGRLSALAKSGFLTGSAGEALLLPGKPHVPFEKVLVAGLGARSDFDAGVFRAAVARIAKTLERLRVRRCVIELPGRGSDAIEADRAMELTLEDLGASPAHDAWWVIDGTAAQKKMESVVEDAQRRARAI
jgi:hypothetical protein